MSKEQRIAELEDTVDFLVAAVHDLLEMQEEVEEEVEQLDARLVDTEVTLDNLRNALLDAPEY